MYDDYGADRFVPMSINLWQDMNSVVKYYARQYTYPFFRDAGTVWNMYRIGNSIPLNYVIDTAGVVLYGSVGFNETVIRAYIESSLPPTGVSEGTGRDVLRILGTGPNPVRDEASLRFVLPKAHRLVLRVYSATGELVHTADMAASAGENTAVWNLAGSSVTSGTYFMELSGVGVSGRARVSVLR
jgi:hypothetical protein